MNNVLPNIMEPFKWLLGEWKGEGVGGFPTMESFRYSDYMYLRLLEDSFENEPIIHFEQIAWVVEKDEKSFKHWETGFIRPVNNQQSGSFEFHVTHNTGRIEVLTGDFQYLDIAKRSFKITFNSEYIRNTKIIANMTYSEKVFELDDDILNFTHIMSTKDYPSPNTHLRSTLKGV